MMVAATQMADMVVCGPYSLSASQHRRPFLITKMVPPATRWSSTFEAPFNSGIGDDPAHLGIPTTETTHDSASSHGH